MNIVYLSLGSNLNDPKKQLTDAIIDLKKLTDTTVIKTSSFYQTKAIGPKQPDFLNIALELHTTLSALDLLHQCQRIELEHHRQRTIHWGPRTLDIDLLLFNNDIIDKTDELIIPHPRMHERGFVLVPLYEIAPKLTIPNNQYSIQSLLNKIDHLDDIQKKEF